MFSDPGISQGKQRSFQLLDLDVIIIERIVTQCNPIIHGFDLKCTCTFYKLITINLLMLETTLFCVFASILKLADI